MEILQTIFLGLLISLSGQLPFSSMNFTALQLNLLEGVKPALRFALGIAVVEMIYVRLSLIGTVFIIQHFKFILALQWLSIALFLLLGINSLIVAIRNRTGARTLMLKNRCNRFLLGAFISAINPLQIPFWFMWSAWLFSNQLLSQTQLALNAYVFGIGGGTLAGIAVYIFCGKWLMLRLKAGTRSFNYILSAFFFLTAFIQTYHLYCNDFIKQ